MTVISILDAIAPNRDRYDAPLCGCPDCGVQPKINPSFYGQVCIYCDNDDCPQFDNDGWPQVMSMTMAEAARKWNALSEDLKRAGSGRGLR